MFVSLDVSMVSGFACHEPPTLAFAVFASIFPLEMLTSSVWQRFAKVDSGQRVQCKLCGAAMLTPNGFTTSLMQSHLERKHPASPAAASSSQNKLRVS